MAELHWHASTSAGSADGTAAVGQGAWHLAVELPAGTLQKIPPEAAASGGENYFLRLVAKRAAAWHIGYKSKTETRKEITK